MCACGRIIARMPKKMSESKLTYRYPAHRPPVQIRLGCFFWAGLIMGACGFHALRTSEDIVAEKDQLAHQNQMLLNEKEHLQALAQVEFQLGGLEEKIIQTDDVDMKRALNQEKEQIILAHHQRWKCFCYQKQLNRSQGE